MLNDADIETMGFNEKARRINQVEHTGQCAHGWQQPVSSGSKEFKCNYCGEIFPDEEAAFEAYEQYL